MLEISFSDSVPVDVESAIMSAIFSNPIHWQNVANEAQQLHAVQLFQELTRARYESDSQKRVADQERQQHESRMELSEKQLAQLQSAVDEKDNMILYVV